jgi:hypothetical protein
MEVDPTYDALIEDLDVTRAYNALFASDSQVVPVEELSTSFFPANETEMFYCDFGE